MLVILFFFSSWLTAFAQDMSDQPKGKPTVYIDYFSRSNNVPFVLSEGLRNNVIQGIQKMSRVILIDVDSNDALRVESQRRSSYNASAGDDNEMDRLAVMSQLGAQYIISGLVTSMTSAWKTNKDGKGYYSGTVAYTLKVINPKDGTLVGTQTYTHNGSGETRDASIDDACKSASSNMSGFVDEYFKMEGTILEINKEKKGKAEEVYINLGTLHGVIENQKFDVYIVREIAGRVSRKEVGRLNVKDVEGEDISLCRVNKGGEEIMAAFNEERQIVIISRGQTLAGEIGNIFR